LAHPVTALSNASHAARLIVVGARTRSGGRSPRAGCGRERCDRPAQ
jgi:hypothetical protein